MVQFDPAQPLAARTFAELAMELHGAPSVTETVEAALDFAVQAVRCAHSGLMLAEGARLCTGAVTDPAVEAIYRWERAAGDGPALTALREQITIGVRDTRAETRWVGWSNVVTALGIGSVLHTPLAIGAETVGVLSLYAGRIDAFGNDDLAIAHILARHASIAVAAARHQESMVQAVDARKLIGQAMGVLMMKFDVDEQRAFAILKRYSQHHNRKLREVAQEVVDTRSLPR
ncbi:GAF and ANTAR domain-containing protein [Kribbella deserti]|uniref:GAF and ANTAR domain-containing protein n=1 Tax=Kribbella deserti TaxID=1926257 RepID=A0ABV6QLQ7_9ACTN